MAARHTQQCVGRLVGHEEAAAAAATATAATATAAATSGASGRHVGRVVEDPTADFIHGAKLESREA